MSNTPSNPLSPSRVPQPSEPAACRVNRISVFFVSLLSMLPWPFLGISLCILGAAFEQDNDFMLMFGGVTLILLIPLGILDPPEWVFVMSFAVVWILMLVLPAFLVARQKLTRRSLTVVYDLQAVFSFVQAGLGLMMIVGRRV